MSDELQESIQGVKTFFCVPDTSIFPEEFLKSFFLKGFETYFIYDDPSCSLEKKVRTLFSIFPQVILFFNIDCPVPGIDWPVFIANLQLEYGERAMIGVMYRKRKNQEEGRSLEWLYLYSIGIICGCIPIDSDKTENLSRFQDVLCANQANGQRRFLRAVCTDSYTATMSYRGKDLCCTLKDISISHFSCVFDENDPELRLHEKLREIQMNLRGVLITVDAVLCLKRVMDDKTVHVFVFRTDEDREGLNTEPLNKVNEIIHASMTEKISLLLKDAFSE